MTTPPKLGAGTRLRFHGPLSAERADHMVADLAVRRPATVVDYGSGWGELLLRVLAAVPGARGTGIDVHGPDLVRGRALAAERGLADRATFVEGPAADHTEPADLVLNLGAYQAFGSIPEALEALRGRVRPGGRLLFGAEVWERTPTEPELAAMWPGMTADACLYLPDLVDAALAAGFRPLRVETASRAEWEEFESGYGADVEEWLLDNPGHPEAAELRAKLDEHLSIWLRGTHGVFGFAYLTLGVSA
ncbi:SAM-dependent methyltransferase [Catenulispora rubra]|uniref:SAM-dependent methyltransferase n=1 Tax=Catenulispora rubra TaxID=280293 RepID=UPI0018924147|nr:class I SAM-dependent methyltransferase [Catenulispora rubra]